MRCMAGKEPFTLKKKQKETQRAAHTDTHNWRLTICQPKRYRDVSIENVRQSISIVFFKRIRKTKKTVENSSARMKISRSQRCCQLIKLKFSYQNIFYIHFKFKLAFKFDSISIKKSYFQCVDEFTVGGRAEKEEKHKSFNFNGPQIYINYLVLMIETDDGDLLTKFFSVVGILGEIEKKTVSTPSIKSNSRSST